MFILLLMVFFAPKLQGQDVCLSASCGQVELELIRQEPNVSAQCLPPSGTCSANNFHQITYKAYLRYADNDLPTQGPFFLGYSEIHIGLNLVQVSNPQFSHFDATTTQCLYNNSAQGTMWNGLNTSDEVIFQPTENRISINFQNGSATNACGTAANGGSNRIQMQPGRPPMSLSPPCLSGQRCFYAELFTVVVNAYPGETVRFDTDARLFKPYGGGIACDIAKITSGSNSGFLPLDVFMPPLSSTSLINNKLEASLAVGTPDPDGTENVNVVLTNTNAAPVSITFLEFVVNAGIVNNLKPLAYTGNIPDEITVQGSPIKYLRYTIQTPIMVTGGGGTVTLSTIKIPPPSPNNISWSYCFNINNTVPTPGTFRIKTVTGGCTSLNINLDAASACKTITADTPCNLPLNFTVSPGEITCGTSTVNVGFRTTLPPQQYQVGSLEFILDFTWTSPNISFSGVNFPAGLPFGQMDCETNGCYSNNNVQSCHTWDAVNKRLHFCISNGPYYWNLPDLDDVTLGLVFNTPEGACITGVEVNYLYVGFTGGFANECVPTVDPTDGFEICGGDLTDMAQGLIQTELSEGVEAVTVTFEAASSVTACPALVCQGSCSATSITGDPGQYMFSCQECPNCNRFKVTPRKNDNPLNGITTYDLVLISRHILGITPLSSPYKIIAADANKSESLTTLDVVELRKLILGIYQDFPMNTSWRFFDKSKSFTNPANPFANQIEDWENIDCLELPTPNLDFVAVKIGDVNNTVVPNRPEKRPVSYISWPALRPAAGEVITLPVYYEGEKTLEALQMGLRFDPAQLRFLGASQGDMDSYLPGNFHLEPELGQIRTLWLPLNENWENVAPHTILFYLSFEAISTIGGTLPMQLDNTLLDAAAWSTEGRAFSLEQSARVTERSEQSSDLIAALRPTPTTGQAILSIESQTTEPCRIAIYGAFGQQLLLKEITLDKGRHDISLQEAEGLPKGVYTWKVFTRSAKTQGHLIKI
jgi:hypothetical protein